MLRKTALLVTAFSFAVMQIAPSYAQEWRRIYAPDDNTLAGVLQDGQVAGMAYMKIPFGGPAYLRKQDVQYGLALAMRMPDNETTYRDETQHNLASVADLTFNADGFRDMQVSGMSGRAAYERMMYKSEGEPSAWWTYGLMALALGVVAVIAVAGKNDGTKANNAQGN